MQTMMRYLAMGAAIAVMGFAAAAPARADIYSQPWDGTGNLYASQNDTTGGNGNFATVYDNFTLGTTSTVTGVDWVGGYFNPPTQGPITAFTISFYADSGGAPGGLLASTSVSGTANETLLTGPNYSYTTAITPFIAAAGTEYWMSIVPDLGFPPQWGWASGTGGDGIAYQDFFGSRSQLGTDLAFGLQGSPVVPEPSSLVLAGLGGMSFLVVYGWRRRRRASV